MHKRGLGPKRLYGSGVSLCGRLRRRKGQHVLSEIYLYNFHSNLVDPAIRINYSHFIYPTFSYSIYYHLHAINKSSPRMFYFMFYFIILTAYLTPVIPLTQFHPETFISNKYHSRQIYTFRYLHLKGRLSG